MFIDKQLCSLIFIFSYRNLYLLKKDSSFTSYFSWYIAMIYRDAHEFSKFLSGSRRRMVYYKISLTKGNEYWIFNAKTMSKNSVWFLPLTLARAKVQLFRHKPLRLGTYRSASTVRLKISIRMPWCIMAV